MYVILLSVLAVAMKPGSKVNTPCSLVRLEMSRPSGPMVPETAFRRVVFPVARFFSSNFVLMRFSDGWFALGSAALHGRTSESREHFLGRARTRGAHEPLARMNSAPFRRKRSSQSSLGFCSRRILLAEFIDAPAGIHNFLLAGIERMAVGANFNLQILANGRASLELVAAGAGDRDDFVIRMNAGFHGNLNLVKRQNRRAPQRCASPRRSRTWYLPGTVTTRSSVQVFV